MNNCSRVETYCTLTSAIESVRLEIDIIILLTINIANGTNSYRDEEKINKVHCVCDNMGVHQIRYTLIHDLSSHTI